jgi:hypothetical protein
MMVGGKGSFGGGDLGPASKRVKKNEPEIHDKSSFRNPGSCIQRFQRPVLFGRHSAHVLEDMGEVALIAETAGRGHFGERAPGEG